MHSKWKLLLDIAMGTVIPVLILSNLNAHLGTTGSYVVAALVPVAWVCADLFFITKRFNFITSYVGASAIVSGILAFWFVDGVQFALKDSVGYALTVLVFGGSMLIGRPIMAAFVAQALAPRSQRHVRLLTGLFAERRVAQAIVAGTALILGMNILAALANFMLNLRMVTAAFGTVAFNQQIAEVNAITRVALGIPDIIGLLVAIVLIRRALAQSLPDEEDDEDFWELLERRAAEGPSGDKAHRFSGTVIIIGAGAAGLAAGYYLRQQNVAFQILEASHHYGGRMKTCDAFADFPIPLGAEWLSADRSIFDQIVNDPDVTVKVKTVSYKKSDPVATWQDGKLVMDELGSFDEKKFVNGTWLNFFETYIVPSVAQHIVYEAPVTAIDYTGDGVVVTANGTAYRADRVIVTAPLPLLQQGSIRFTPPLPRDKAKAVAKADVWEGLKVFIEFSERFYPTYVDVHVEPKNAGHVSYFDAAYGQKTTRHILGLFAVGAPARPYLARSDAEIKAYILDELEAMFPGKAKARYVNHLVQNWSAEPYIAGAYLNDYENWKTLPVLAEPVAEKVYFAGDAYTAGNDWGNVHDAALSARRAVRKILR